MLGLSSSTQSKMANELSRYTKKERERERERERESFDISRSQWCIVVFCPSHRAVKRNRFSQ